MFAIHNNQIETVINKETTTWSHLILTLTLLGGKLKLCFQTFKGPNV